MFYIDSDKNILFGEAERRRGSLSFRNESELQALADNEQWTRQDLEAIWNSFAGVAPFGELKPVKKFRNRPYGVKQIWNAIQLLADSPVGDGPVKPKVATAKQKRAKGGQNKKLQAAALMLRKDGATAEDLSKQLGWGAGSVVMFVQWVKFVLGSGIRSLAVEKNEDGDRVYKAS
jgi:hypothetical protein